MSPALNVEPRQTRKLILPRYAVTTLALMRRQLPVKDVAVNDENQQ